MNIVMTHSYKGGSGKTLFSINTANILREVFKKKILLIEADFSMPVFHSIFNNFHPDLFFNDYLNNNKEDLQRFIYPHPDAELGIIFCNPVFSPNDRIFTTEPLWYENILRRLSADLEKLDYDYVLFDLSPGKNLFVATILLLCDTIFTIMRADNYSVEGVDSLFREFYSSVSLLSDKKFHVVFNQVPKYSGIQQILTKWLEKISLSSEQIQSINFIEFEHETGYFVAEDNLLLAKKNPTHQKIQNIVKNSFELQEI